MGMEVLKIGALGDTVKLLQKALDAHGYPTVVDGSFGPATEKTLLAFQVAKGLVEDGIAGPATWNALSLIPIKKPSLAKGEPAWYEEKYRGLTYDLNCAKAIEAAGLRVTKNRARYELAAKSLGLIPWYFIAGIHNMEASGSFQGVLHNGQKIIGTGRRTTIVPIGRGPFNTWEESAVDALTWKGLHLVLDWSLGNLLKIAERYNGAGYLTGAGRAENSPYLWAMSSVNDGRGKYVSDGSFDPNADANQQVGFATLMHELERLGQIKLT